MSVSDVRKRMAKEAEQAPSADPMRCTAKGCPMRWSCDMGKGKLCSWHDVAKPHDWLTISAELDDVLAHGLVPQRPEIPSAPWVAEAVARAKLGPHTPLPERDAVDPKQRATDLTAAYQRRQAELRP
jgi:hypothetical protein